MTKEEAIEKQYAMAVANFEKVLKEKKSEFIRDAAILRFELTFDLAWKCLKRYLQSKKNTICLSPKDCFREGYAKGIITYEDKWIKLADERNAAVHTYKKELAEALYEKLPEFLKLFKELEKALKK